MRTVIITSKSSAVSRFYNCLRPFEVEITGIFASLAEGYESIISEKPDIIFIGMDCGKHTEADIKYAIRAALPETTVVYCDDRNKCCGKSRKFVLMPADDTQAAVNGVKIECFGRFTVRIGGREIKFATKKARELLAFILSRYRQPVSRAEALEAVFNTGNTKSDLNNFRVTLHRLRQILADTEVKKILQLGEDLSVGMPPGIADLTLFLDFIHSCGDISICNIERAKKMLKLAEAELFEDITAPWASQFRKLAAVHTEELIMKTASYLLGTDTEKNAGERYLLGLLERNALSEQAYVMLLELYINEGATEKYERLYKKYAGLLRAEAGRFPDVKYAEYYLKLAY